MATSPGNWTGAAIRRQRGASAGSNGRIRSSAPSLGSTGRRGIPRPAAMVAPITEAVTRPSETSTAISAIDETSSRGRCARRRAGEQALGRAVALGVVGEAVLRLPADRRVHTERVVRVATDRRRARLLAPLFPPGPLPI